MNKIEQIEVNEIVTNVYQTVDKAEYYDELIYCCSLEKFNAKVYRFCTSDGDWYVMRSYSTIVAAVAPDGRCYDFLRYVYGYTTASARHISKFFNGFGSAEKYVYREV